MSIEQTKKQLAISLADPDNKVIALSGKWGTGKTKLWESLLDEAKEKLNDQALAEKEKQLAESLTKSVYISLFGLSSTDQLKRKLVETIIPTLEKKAVLAQLGSNILDTVAKVGAEYFEGLKHLNQTLGALNNLNLALMTPGLMMNRILGIDDIERKHTNLGIDEVLGFIDEYSKKYNCRFVLILNDDQISGEDKQKELWAKLREKVIDHEIKLVSTSAECFQIAKSLISAKHIEAIEKPLAACQITNIRVAVKIIKNVRLFLGERDLDHVVLARTIPSLVLFSAIHFRSLEDGPDFSFAMKAGYPDFSSFTKKSTDEKSETEIREERWKLLLQELEIISTDRFEELLVEFFETGIYDQKAIDEIIEGYQKEKVSLESREYAIDFLRKEYWEHKLSNADLLDLAKQLPDCAAHIDPYIATDLHEVLLKMDGGKEIAEAVISRWISAFEERKNYTMDRDNLFNRPVHNSIKEAFDKVIDDAQSKTTVVDAVMHMIDSSGYGVMQEIAMRSATEKDFIHAIETLDPENLRRFLRRMTEIAMQRESYAKTFGDAVPNFLAACKHLAHDASRPRLARLVTRSFATSPLATEVGLEAPKDSREH